MFISSILYILSISNKPLTKQVIRSAAALPRKNMIYFFYSRPVSFDITGRRKIFILHVYLLLIKND